MKHSIWKGSHYESGLRQGALLYGRHINLMEHLAVDRARLDYARACVPVYQRYFPEILDEIRGMADGQRADLEQMQAFLLSMYSFAVGNRCSCFAYSDEETVILGRNSDFLTEVEPFCDSPLYRLEGSAAFVGVTTAWTQMEDGVNEHGLAAGLTFMYPTRIAPGFNAGLLVRYILERCGTVAEAVKALERLPVGSAQAITLADRGGDAAVVECNCRRMEVIRPERPGAVFAANHFVTGALAPDQAQIPDTVHSHERYETMSRAFAGQKTWSVRQAEALLAGKMGFMCQYDRSLGMDTVWSSIYDLKNGAILRAEGNPSRSAFELDQRLKPGL
ncbi:MAG: linear amide C-N hydrolase [Enterocloster asparagiformis]|nr:linear amide C-N hydrolase [Enterocloster asparagiformis]